MLTKNYIEIKYNEIYNKEYKLKYYINRDQIDKIFSCLYDKGLEEICICNSLGALDRDIMNSDIHNVFNGKTFHDSVLLFFNDRLYRIYETYIDYSDVEHIAHSELDITELRLLKVENMCNIGSLNVTLYFPIYRI